MSHIDCPSCKKDDMVQKITAIVDGETTNTSGYSHTSGSSDLSGSQNIYDSQGRYIGEGRISGSSSGGSSTSINATQRSNLATMLQPPHAPQKPYPPVYPYKEKRKWVVSAVGGTPCLMIFIVSLVLFVVTFISTRDSNMLLYIGGGGLCLGMLIVAGLQGLVQYSDRVYGFFEDR